MPPSNRRVATPPPQPPVLTATGVSPQSAKPPAGRNIIAWLDSLPVTPQWRAEAIRRLNAIMPSAPLHGAWNEPTKVFTADTQEPHPSGLQPDPTGELAATLLQRRYPALFSGVPSITLGDTTLPRGIGGITYNERRIAMPPSNGDLFTTLDNLRHELAHVGGLPDAVPDPYAKPKPPDAYDVSYLSSVLHRDIQLPPEPK